MRTATWSLLDEDSRIVARARRGPEGEAIMTDA